MADYVVCPDCERKLRVPQNLIGKPVRCPACQKIFTAKVVAGAAKAAPPAKKGRPAPARRHDDDDEEGQRYDLVVEATTEEAEDQPKRGLLEEHLRKQILDDRSKRGKRPFADNWRKARLGVRILSLAVLMLVANFIVQSAGRGIIYLSTQPDPLEPNASPQQIANYKQRVADGEADRKASNRYLSSAVAIVYLVHHVVALVGIGLCLLSPDKNHLRLLAVAPLVLALAGLGMEIALSIAPLEYLISGAVDAQGGIAAPNPALRIACDLVGYLRFFAFLFFMRAVAKLTKTDDLSREVIILMVVMAATIIYWLVMASLTAAKMPGALGSAVGGIVIEGSLIGVFGAASLALVLAATVWFSMTLHSTAVAITDWLRER